MTEREEALELAREAGVMPDALSGHYIATEDVLIRIARLAKQRGAEESLELLIAQGFITDDGTETSYAKKARATIKKAEEMR